MKKVMILSVMSEMNSAAMDAGKTCHPPAMKPAKMESTHALPVDPPQRDTLIGVEVRVATTASTTLMIRVLLICGALVSFLTKPSNAQTPAMSPIAALTIAYGRANGSKVSHLKMLVKAPTTKPLNGPMIIPANIEPNVSAQIGVPAAKYAEAMLTPTINGTIAMPKVENSILNLEGLASVILATGERSVEAGNNICLSQPALLPCLTSASTISSTVIISGLMPPEERPIASLVICGGRAPESSSFA
jgi:hypothetical protein